MSDTPEPIQVLITVKFSDELLETFRAISPQVEILYHPARQVRDIPDDVWARADVLYTGEIAPEPVLAPRLRWIHAHYAGVDHLIRMPIMQSEDVTLTTTSGIHATNIAEYAFMMMLALGHRLPEMLAMQREARWPSGGEEYRALRPLELRGSTIGIVGYGSIGREIARVARLFSMEVLATKRDVRHPSDSGSYVIPNTGDPEGTCFDRLYPPEALNTMVRECDFVVITVPLTDATRLMFGADAFEAMKETAYLVNVGRGGVVDEEALLHALQTGQIAGAAMDVFAAEPLPADSPLWQLPNLLISPHISGQTADYNDKAAALFVENVRRYAEGKSLLNVVDLAAGY
ncbi:MAG: D-2-hydroxyacid dehydrogenase [Anaerolineae bacterium]|nr:D-2-hydroxyacid dehydrogenase [Anaerolineae bacterium]